MNRFIYFLASATVILSSTLLSQIGTLSGALLDRNTKEPIPFANIVIRGSTRGTTTDSLGMFRLSMPANSTEVISFTHVAYEKASYDVNLEGKNLDVTVELEPRTIGLAGFVVSGRRSLEERAAMKVITEKDIEEYAPVRIEDVIKYRAPLALLSRSSLSVMRGQRDYAVFWNGIRLGDGNTDFIDPYSVTRIFVWRGTWAPLYYYYPGSARYVIDIRTK